jgi:hypothetical protein
MQKVMIIFLENIWYNKYAHARDTLLAELSVCVVGASATTPVIPSEVEEPERSAATHPNYQTLCGMAEGGRGGKIRIVICKIAHHLNIF